MKFNICKNDAHMFSYECCTEQGVVMSSGLQGYRTVHLSGAALPAAFIGAIATEPEYRRYGLVRTGFTEMAAEADRRGVPLSVLHPFSFAYYRKFGFERVSDHRVLSFPTEALNNFSRYTDLVRAANEHHGVLADLYNTFAAERNLLPVRDKSHPFLTSKDGEGRTYISYDEQGNPDGYITLEAEKYFSVNRVVSVQLHVHEMIFISPAALDKLFGFLRMYEGEMETVCIHNCGMSPEIELRLRNYMHTKIEILPDIMARINDVEAVLSAVRYPKEAGRFTVRTTEAQCSPWSALSNKSTGVWQVDYADGVGKVTRLSDDSDCDFEAEIGAFTQLVFAYESGGYDIARYTHGTVFYNRAEDFFRAFPKRPGGVFEHF